MRRRRPLFGTVTVAVTVVVAGVALLGGCTGSGDDQAAPERVTPDLITCLVTDTNGVDDHGLNSEGLTGLDDVRKRLGSKVVTIESMTAPDYPVNIDTALAQGCDVVVGGGPSLGGALTASAATHADQRFLLLGGPLTGADGSPATARNATSLSVDSAPAAYLAGYLAAGASKSGKVAALGGVQDATVEGELTAFANGVSAYNQANAGRVTLIGWNPTNRTGTFVGSNTDDARGRTLAKGLLDEGADVIFPVGGSFAAGALPAAKDVKGSFVIWSGGDGSTLPGAANLVLASVVPDLSKELADRVVKINDGEFQAAPWVGTLKNEGVALVRNDNLTTSVPGAVAKQLDDLTKKVTATGIPATTAPAPAAAPNPSGSPTASASPSESASASPSGSTGSVSSSASPSSASPSSASPSSTP